MSREGRLKSFLQTRLVRYASEQSVVFIPVIL